MLRVPECDGSGYGIVTVDDRKDSFNELVHVQDLLQVLLALLGYFQHAEPEEVVPVESLKESRFLFKLSNAKRRINETSPE